MMLCNLLSICSACRVKINSTKQDVAYAVAAYILDSCETCRSVETITLYVDDMLDQ